MESLLAAHVQRFMAHFGPGEAACCFFAPGRVNLMGAHLDYNGGPVMPMAIDRGTFLAARARGDRSLRCASSSEEGEWELDLTQLSRSTSHRTGTWLDYPLGVLVHELERRPEAPGLDLFFGGNLPIGAGLSSSASICIVTALALDRLWDLGGTPLDRVEAALWAEREFVGVHCGIMDPYAVGLSRPQHLLWLDCRDRSTEHLPLDAGLVRIAVADSGVRRELAQGSFNERVAECARAFEALRPAAPDATCLRDVPAEVAAEHGGLLGPVLARRVRHVLDEVERTERARTALVRGELEGFGREMSAAHESLRTLYEVSIPELDTLVEGSLAWEGCLGARLTGAGFGGCVVALLRAAACPGFAEHLSGFFRARHGRDVPVEFFGGDPGPRSVSGPGAEAAAR